MTDVWLREIDKSKIAGAVMLDFRAAFDVIDHEILIEKLKCYGFCPSAITLMKRYLSFRTQRLFYNGSLSDCSRVVCGIQYLKEFALDHFCFQFLLMICPAVNIAGITMYADDVTFYHAVSTYHKLNTVLSRELYDVYDWIKTNSFSFSYIQN